MFFRCRHRAWIKRKKKLTCLLLKKERNCPDFTLHGNPTLRQPSVTVITNTTSTPFFTVQLFNCMIRSSYIRELDYFHANTWLANGENSCCLATGGAQKVGDLL